VAGGPLGVHPIRTQGPSDRRAPHGAKFDLVINVQAAKALALTIPRTLLLRADAVIE